MKKLLTIQAYNTLEFDVDLNTNAYLEGILFKGETRRATLTFSYRFGEQSKKQKRRRPVQQPNDDGGGFGF